MGIKITEASLLRILLVCGWIVYPALTRYAADFAFDVLLLPRCDVVRSPTTLSILMKEGRIACMHASVPQPLSLHEFTLRLADAESRVAYSAAMALMM
ncbi:hypothetical protein RB213_007094 [Colletotrichum asianum]